MKTLVFKSLLIAGIAAAAMLASCGKDTPTEPTAPEEPEEPTVPDEPAVYDVYVAGCKENAAGKWVAMLWKNGTPQELSDGKTFAIANSIAVAGNDVYAAGYKNDAMGWGFAMLWKNGTPQELSDGKTSAEAKSIAVEGNDV